MIYIGETDKLKIINDYINSHNIRNIFIIGDYIELNKVNTFEKFNHEDKKSNDYLQKSALKSDYVNWCTVHATEYYRIMYYYLQNITTESLLILNEPLITINRYCLDYNCIRHFCQNKPHILIFNYYPVISSTDDFMILNDFNSENPFKKEQYKYVSKFNNVIWNDPKLNIIKNDIILNEKEIKKYEELKQAIFKSVKKDPDILPRRLLKYSESCNLKYIQGLDSKDKIKKEMNIGVNQTGVDKYYYEKILNFKNEVEDVKNKIYR